MRRRLLAAFVSLLVWGAGLTAQAAGTVRMEALRLILLPPLPANATTVQLAEGFDPERAAPRGDAVVDRGGLAAGDRRRLALMYALPGSDQLDAAIPLGDADAAVEVVVPAGVTLSTPGLVSRGTVALNGQDFRRYVATEWSGERVLRLRASSRAGSEPPLDWLAAAANAGVILLLLVLPAIRPGITAPGEGRPPGPGGSGPAGPPGQGGRAFPTSHGAWGSSEPLPARTGSPT